ncbi:MAG: bile acid:sodium symporter family protein [bacterium]
MQELDNLKINFDQDGLWVLNIALAAVMFGVALNITTDDFRALLKKPKWLLSGIISQFLVLPLCTYILILLMKPQPSIALGMMMVAACPGGNISNFMTHLAKGNTALSVSLTAFATLFAIIFTPLNFQFYGNLYQPTAALLTQVSLEPFDVLKVVLLILGIPLVLGMICRRNFPEFSKKASKVLKPLSIVVFIAIVAIAFSNNLDVFNNYIQEVLLIGIVHNAMALVLGLSIAFVFMLKLKERKTITIETGIQNSGLGLLLIFTFFNGLGGMALIAAFWGIWHIISGLVVASIWSRKV